jgi:Ca2+-binding EF-hand superfamily protein
MKRYAQGVRDTVENCIRRFDQHQTMFLSIADFQQVLKAMNVQFDDQRLNKLIIELDTTKDGQVDLEELIRRCNGQSKTSTLAKIKAQPHHWANLVFQRIKQYLDDNGLKIMDIFREYDRNSDNYVSHDEFRQLLNERIHIQL